MPVAPSRVRPAPARAGAVASRARARRPAQRAESHGRAGGWCGRVARAARGEAGERILGGWWRSQRAATRGWWRGGEGGRMVVGGGTVDLPMAALRSGREDAARVRAKDEELGRPRASSLSSALAAPSLDRVRLSLSLPLACGPAAVSLKAFVRATPSPLPPSTTFHASSLPSSSQLPARRPHPTLPGPTTHRPSTALEGSTHRATWLSHIPLAASRCRRATAWVASSRRRRCTVTTARALCFCLPAQASLD